MGISFVGSGGGSASTSAIGNIAWPTGHQAGDLGILFLESAGESQSFPGWTEAPGSPVDYGTGAAGSADRTTLQVLYRVATSSSMSAGDQTHADTWEHLVWQLVAFRGVNTLNPFAASYGTSGGESNSANFAAATSSFPNSAVLLCSSIDRDTSSTGTYGNFTSTGNVSGITEILDRTTSLGTGGGLGVSWGTLVSAGSTGTLARTLATTDQWTSLTLILNPSEQVGSLTSTGASAMSAVGAGVIVRSGSLASAGASAAAFAGDVLPFILSGSGAATVLFSGKSLCAASLFAPGIGSALFGNASFGPHSLIATASGACAWAGKSIPRFAPTYVWPGYVYDSGAGAIVLPISQLVGLTSAHADPSTGDWRQLVQALLLSQSQYFDALAPIEATARVPMPRTMRAFVLEDWNRKDTRFGRHMKRLFLIEFIVENSPTTVFNSGE